MRIEHYDPKFKEDVIVLIRSFHEQYLKAVDPTIYALSIDNTIAKFEGEDRDKAFLMVDGEKCVGLIAGIEIKSYLNDHKIYSEIFWFIDKGYGMFAPWFIAEVEKKLKEQGYHIIVMAILASDKSKKLQNMYEAMDYQYLETHYMKHLKPEAVNA